MAKKLKKQKKNKYLTRLIVGIVVVILIIILFVLLKEEKWIQKGNIITKGDVTLNVGDYYEYDESNGGIVTGLTDVNWKVLGVDEKGNLLIVAASNVEELTLGSANDLTVAQKDYIEGYTKLNEISKKYAQGLNAISGRSITNDDINKITRIEYDENVDYTNTYGKFERITLSHKCIKYFWENEKITYELESGEIGESSIKYDDRFIWFNKKENKWEESLKTNTKTEITKQYNDLLAYNGVYLVGEEIKYLVDEGSKEFNMLFLDDEGNKSKYWTSNKYINATKNYIGYGYNVIKHSDLNYNVLVYSSGITREATFGVRAVITIK